MGDDWWLQGAKKPGIPMHETNQTLRFRLRTPFMESSESSSDPSLLPPGPVTPLSLPLFIEMGQPCCLSLLARAVLRCIPGKSFAWYTVTGSLMAEATIGTFWVDRGSNTMNLNLSRYAPGVRQERSGKVKKHPSSPNSSFPKKGTDTTVPISRLAVRESSTILEQSSSPFSLKMVQCIVECEPRCSFNWASDKV